MNCVLTIQSDSREGEFDWSSLPSAGQKKTKMKAQIDVSSVYSLRASIPRRQIGFFFTRPRSTWRNIGTRSEQTQIHSVYITTDFPRLVLRQSIRATLWPKRSRMLSTPYKIMVGLVQGQDAIENNHWLFIYWIINILLIFNSAPWTFETYKLIL